MAEFDANYIMRYFNQDGAYGAGSSAWSSGVTQLTDGSSGDQYFSYGEPLSFRISSLTFSGEYIGSFAWNGKTFFALQQDDTIINVVGRIDSSEERSAFGQATPPCPPPA